MSKATLFLSKFIPHSLERRIRTFRDIYFRNYKIEPLPQEIYSSELHQHSISFCTNCMNRLYHLRHTMEENINANSDYGAVEFVLVNYNSRDGMHEWARKHLSKYIDQGILNYYHTKDPQYFHMSKAKNLAHKLAGNEIVCNLDGDNYTGKDFAFYINYLFNEYGLDNIFHFKKAPYWGTEGRIVLSRKNFVRLGGYDESFHPAGHQDHDLIFRGQKLGLDYKVIEVENFLRYLSNSTKEKSTGLAKGKVNYYELRDQNIEKSNKNLSDGKLVANMDKGWGKSVVYKNFSPKPIILD
ncbi:glycosyltransferase family 2 protein [Marivirga sp. S37H4]|uniref:Glycosyltransferase family 2 protein n=1 Tax=Marivirga aurantiaca TaxID=2802615 RepID=A0A934X090_9BACT|nr:glycosyltransferase family A protein [Marivirga aurantiaca]MBK6266513.1 glycosyltransferase family 2 protein [Marivirga aurantiaca]